LVELIREMGVEEEYGLGAIRISIGRHSSSQEVKRGIERILATAKNLQREES